MGLVAYIDHLAGGNAAAVAAIEDDADPAPVTYRNPTTATRPDVDPLEDTIYVLDASTSILTWAAAVGATVTSIDDLLA